MQLDVYTILIATAAALFLFGLQFLYFWLRDRRATWLAWWSAPFGLGAVATVVRIQRGQLDDIVTIGLGNACILLALGFAWQGARVFSRRQPRWELMVLLPATWIGLCLYPPFMSDLGLRVMVGSGMMALFVGLAAFELWRNRAEHLPSRLPAVVVLTSFSIVMLSRIPLIGVLPFPVGALPVDAVWIGVFNFVTLFHTVSITVLMISMTKERREAEQREYAQSDPLTGLANRRAFVSDAARLLRRHGHTKQPLSVVVLDLDHFKSVNDRFGHETGDKVLVRFAEILRQCLRPADMIYRMGGEEFCCLLPDVRAKEAKAIADRICTEVGSKPFETLSGHIRVTVSIGVASSELTGLDLDVLLGEADAALYEAKATGRNIAVLGGEVIYRPTVAITRHYAA